MIDTIRPPTTMLMLIIASGPTIGDHPVETALQFCLIEFGNASSQCGQLASFLANADMRIAIGGNMAEAASASESRPP